MAFFLTADFWPKVLVTTDFCDIEFNNYVSPIIQNILIFMKIALGITD